MSTGAVISSLIAESLVTILYLKYCDGFLSFKFLLKSSWKKATCWWIYAFWNVYNNASN